MKYRCRVAYVQCIGIISMLLMLPIVSVAQVADAEVKTPLWEYPGSFPYIGPKEVACERLNKIGAISIAGCEKGQEMLRLKMCDAYYLKDGEEVVTTFTVNGKHRAKKLKVNFRYPANSPEAGKPIPADDEKRLVFSCHLGGEDNKALALPLVCGNWTVHVRAPTLPPPVAEVPEEEECGFVETGQTAQPGITVLTSSTIVEACDITIFSSGVVSGIQAQTQTSSKWVCNQ